MFRVIEDDEIIVVLQRRRDGRFCFVAAFADAISAFVFMSRAERGEE